jgi:hypothetical protein
LTSSGSARRQQPQTSGGRGGAGRAEPDAVYLIHVYVGGADGADGDGDGGTDADLDDATEEEEEDAGGGEARVSSSSSDVEEGDDASASAAGAHRSSSSSSASASAAAAAAAAAGWVVAPTLEPLVPERGLEYDHAVATGRDVYSFNQCSTGRLNSGINVVTHWW